MEVRVEILKQAITTQYGTLNQGDLLRTNRAFAAHLVNECGVAKYSAPVATQHPTAAIDVLESELVVSASEMPALAQPDPNANVETGLIAGDMAADDATVAITPMQSNDSAVTDVSVQTSAQDADGAAAEPAARKSRSAAKRSNDGE